MESNSTESKALLRQEQRQRLDEASSLVRWFHVSFYLPSSGGDAWEEDSLSYTTICQWHEFEQPNGARQPPIEFVVAAGNVLQAGYRTTSASAGLARPAQQKLPLLLSSRRWNLVDSMSLSLLAKAGASNDYLTVWLDGTQGAVPFWIHGVSGRNAKFLQRLDAIAIFRHPAFRRIGPFISRDCCR